MPIKHQPCVNKYHFKEPDNHHCKKPDDDLGIPPLGLHLYLHHQYILFILVVPVNLPTCTIIYLTFPWLGNDDFDLLRLCVWCLIHLLPPIQSLQLTLHQSRSVYDEVMMVMIHPNKCHHHCMPLIVLSNDTLLTSQLQIKFMTNTPSEFVIYHSNELHANPCHLFHTTN